MLTFRPATETDVDALTALVESAYRGCSSQVGWTTEAHLLDGQRTNADGVRERLPLIVLGESGGELVVCFELELTDDNAQFGMFAVRPGTQGVGIGGQALAHAERIALERGARQVRLKVIAQRAELIAWYERRGYALTGETSPFPYGDERFGKPRRPDLVFATLSKALPVPA
ncbi:GNAT family N-acetyltransferase [Actinokineospora pegani]|uniref:GNAT family N-acetyltransferase n=1 Tax=Actinokineospora pegani TaxID=2654637 RepID=UPI0012EA7680|nr:GNAT family N-acetyltransferase [Actinokineospora pegani]